jgi:thymidine phosphorylase
MKLARSLVDVGRKMKAKVMVLITDMEQPLGRAIGNALEVRECIDSLHGRGPSDLEDLSIALASHMIHLGRGARTLRQASKMASEAVTSGRAAQRFREIIRIQGGNERVIDDADLLAISERTQTFRASTAGFVTRCDAKLLGLASSALGAGRNRVEDSIDPSVGIYLDKKVGERVSKGEPLCRIYWNDEARLREALPLIKRAYEIKSRPRKPRPLIQAVVTR